jgi:hypothetical protein
MAKYEQIVVILLIHQSHEYYHLLKWTYERSMISKRLIYVVTTQITEPFLKLKLRFQLMESLGLASLIAKLNEPTLNLLMVVGGVMGLRKEEWI